MGSKAAAQAKRGMRAWLARLVWQQSGFVTDFINHAV
jgi:hypothetical protein